MRPHSVVSVYRIPKDLDLSPVVGEFTTQIEVGQFDLQFVFGPVRFAVQNAVTLLRAGSEVAKREPGIWPDAEFFNLMNSEAVRCEAVHDRLLEIEVANGLVVQLRDDSDDYECMQIKIDGDPMEWII